MPMVVPPGFRLIDTRSNSIVKCATQVDYLALSYCWAGTSSTPEQNIQLQLANFKQLSQENGLDVSNLPPVIADAIRLCRDLGKRYLWVDPLCIIQDDAKSKHSKTTAMDRIYHMADFAIVALSSTPGLPGVSSRPRDTSFESLYGLGDGSFINSSGAADVPIASWAIRHSRWDTRGWTFQERKLSRGLVFVDGLHTHFSCFRGVHWEHDMRNLDAGPDSIPVSVETGLQVEPKLTSYAKIVTPYSMRQLSFRSDILNTFSGVGNILASRTETSMLYGLPERYFLQSLLWQSDDCSRGRDADLGIPSWSWAAWDGTVDYGFRQTFGQRSISPYQCALNSFKSDYSYEVGSLVTFFYSDLENGAGVVRLVEDSLCWFAFQYMDGDEFSEHLSEERKKIEEPMDEKGHERELTWRRCCHNPWEALHHEAIADEAQAKAATIPVSLVFTTTCVFLTLQQTMQDRIETPIVVCFDMTSTSTDGDVCLFVGQTILMNREWAEQKFDVNWKYFVIVLGAGVSGYIERHGQPGWKDQASGAPWVPT